MLTIPLKTRLIRPKDNLFKIILETLRNFPLLEPAPHQDAGKDGARGWSGDSWGLRLKNGDILGIVSKVVSYSEGRLVSLKEHPLSYWVKKEADQVFGANRYIVLTLKNHCLIPNAGIDQSNAPKGMAILWPKDPFKTAQDLQKELKKIFKIKKLGILIADSTCQPLRLGTTGRAIGWAGFTGVEDQRGRKDLFGKTMRVTQKAVADNLASTALLEVGETSESTPFILFRGAPVRFTKKKAGPKDAWIAPEECIFKGLNL